MHHLGPPLQIVGAADFHVGKAGRPAVDLHRVEARSHVGVRVEIHGNGLQDRAAPAALKGVQHLLGGVRLRAGSQNERVRKFHAADIHLQINAMSSPVILVHIFALTFFLILVLFRGHTPTEPILISRTGVSPAPAVWVPKRSRRASKTEQTLGKSAF